MTDAARKLLEQVLALPDEDRHRLVEELVAAGPQIDPAVRAAWTGEAIQRLERAELGEHALVSYDDVRARAESILRHR